MGEAAQLLEPISLGGSCASKFHACRRLYLDVNPQGSVERLREALLFKRSADLFTRHLFDWQITPLKAVIAYLEADFTGVFDLGDLVIDVSGAVAHDVLRTLHPHDFHPMDEALGPADIEAQYPAARAKFDHLADKFRRHLQAPGPFLYVVGGAAQRQEAQRLVKLLARHPQHSFRILFAPPPSSPDLSDLDDRIAQATLDETQARAKPAGQEWEGDDAAWTRVLEPFALGLPRGPRFSVQLNPIPDLDGLHLDALPLGWWTPPSWNASGPAPQDFQIPPRAWDYAAASGAVDGYAVYSPRTLYVSLEAVQGRVGVGLARPDGSGSVGAEYCLSQDEGLMHLPLQLEPGMGPACIVLRNYGEDGVGSIARVHAVRLGR